MSVSDFISLLGGVALFLFGMSIMGDALKKVAGNQLELVLYNLTSTPIKGVLLGTGVTAVIQSSSATSVMVVGFVNSGMMKVNQAIGIVLGAILGTSVTGWVLCLSNLTGARLGDPAEHRHSDGPGGRRRHHPADGREAAPPTTSGTSCWASRC